MDTYEKQLEDLCRDMVTYHLVKTGMNAKEAFEEYRDNPSLRSEVEGLASIHVRKMSHRESPESTGLKNYGGATHLGNGLYRLTSPNRSAVTGRFDQK